MQRKQAFGARTSEGREGGTWGGGKDLQVSNDVEGYLGDAQWVFSPQPELEGGGDGVWCDTTRFKATSVGETSYQLIIFYPTLEK